MENHYIKKWRTHPVFLGLLLGTCIGGSYLLFSNNNTEIEENASIPVNTVHAAFEFDQDVQQKNEDPVPVVVTAGTEEYSELVKQAAENKSTRVLLPKTAKNTVKKENPKVAQVIDKAILAGNQKFTLQLL